VPNEVSSSKYAQSLLSLPRNSELSGPIQLGSIGAVNVTNANAQRYSKTLQQSPSDLNPVIITSKSARLKPRITPESRNEWWQGEGKQPVGSGDKQHSRRNVTLGRLN
jgi:hypothetical protein